MDSTNTHLLPGTVLGNKWRLGNRLGAGACADVFDVESTASPSAASSSSPVPYVAKCIALPTGNTKSTAYKERNRVCDTLFYEYTLYTNGVLYGFDYAPKIPPGAYGNDKGHRYLIMEKLDYDLKSMVSRRASSLTVGRIAEIGLDVLSGLEFIHKKVNICL
jgi:serine/threonine protein kinase